MTMMTMGLRSIDRIQSIHQLESCLICTATFLQPACAVLRASAQKGLGAAGVGVTPTGTNVAGLSLAGSGSSGGGTGSSIGSSGTGGSGSAGGGAASGGGGGGGGASSYHSPWQWTTITATGE
uniref:Uncharacterized protein n=1 Tax=Anopheles epiroticus TaxID=199890 RepID=A0A182PDA4_9DIPT